MPIGFKWIFNKKLAGSGRPGLYNDIDVDIRFMKNVGITTIVNLTETDLDNEFAENGFDVIHFPIVDMSIPTPKNAYLMCTDIKSRLDNGEIVLVHCKGGLGRTGTILACTLVEYGYTPDLAITEVRKNIQLAIQNHLQEHFIVDYDAYRMKQVESA